MTEELIDFDNWVDMRVGETGTMLAYLESVIYGNYLESVIYGNGVDPGSIIVKNAEWDNMVFECPGVKLKLTTVPLGTLMFWRIKRTEDGVEALACWKQGSVPIPLQDAA